MENLPSFDDVSGEVTEVALPSFDDVGGEVTEVADTTVDKPSLGSQVADYMLVPESDSQPKSEAYQKGYDSYVKPELKVNRQPDVAPELDANTLTSWFSGRNFDVASVNSYMDYQQANGMTKNEALTALKEEGASPLDLQTAVYADNAKRRDLNTEEAFQTHVVEPAGRGYMRGRFATMGLANDLNKALGIDTTEDEAKLEEAKGVFKASQDNFEDKYGITSPLEFTPEIATFAISGGGALIIGAKEMAAEFLISKGDGFSNGQSLARSFIVGSIAGGITRLVDGPTTSVNSSGLTDETENLLEFAGIKKGSDEYKDLSNQAKQVANDDQARIVAEQLGADDLGFKKNALKGADDQTRRAYSKVMAERTAEVAKATGLDDFPAIKVATQEQYDTMREVAKNVSLGKYYNVEGIASELEAGKNAFLNTPAEGRIDKLIAQIRDKPAMALDDVIDIRQAINYEYGRTTDKSAKAMLTKLKGDVDLFMKDAELPPSVFQMVEAATKSYHRMRSQEELLSYMADAQVSLFKGSKYGEVTVTDWTKLADTLKAEGAPAIIQDEAKLMGALSKKYSGSERDLLQATRPAGETENVGAIIAESPEGFARTSLTQRAIESLQKWMPVGDKGKKLRIQVSIRNSMAKAKTYPEFAENLIRDKNTPMKIRAEMQKYLDEHEDLLAITGPASKAESIALVRKTQKMKTVVDSADRIATKANVRKQQFEARGVQLDEALDAALQEGDDAAINAIQRRINNNKIALDDATKKADISHRAYTLKKADYDDFTAKNSKWLKDSEKFGEGLKDADMPEVTFRPQKAEREFPSISGEIPRNTPPHSPDKPVKPFGDTGEGSFLGAGIKKADDFETTTSLPVAKPTVYVREDGSVNINRPYYDSGRGRELDATSQIQNSEGAGRDRASVANFRSHEGDSRVESDSILGLDATKKAMDTDDSAIKALEVYLPDLENKFGKPFADLAKTIVKDNPQMALHIKNTRGRTVEPGVGGSSDSPQGVVKLPKGAQGSGEGASTFLHEIVHQATVQRYNEDRVFRQAMDNLFAYAKKERGSGGYGKGKNQNGLYWEANTKEMMAEAFSNPEAQKELMAIPTPSWFREKYPKLNDTVKNAWDAFVYLVTGNLGKSIPDDNMLTAMGDLLASNVNKAPTDTAQGATDLIKSAMNVDPFIKAGLKQADDVADVSSFTKALESSGIKSMDSDVEDLLEAASIPVKERKGKMERLIRRSQHNPNVDVPRAIIDTTLTTAQAKRLKAGKGTPEDIEMLKEDIVAYRIEYGGASQDTPIEDILKGKI